MQKLFIFFIDVLLLSFVHPFPNESVSSPSLQNVSTTDPEVRMNITEVIEMNGYYAEEHYVETEDHYILCLIRMRNSSILRENPKVVFLQHGLFDTAHTWVNNLRNQSLGFILADAGYDVWLGNSRGTTYSRRHAKLTSDDRSYWDFSWEEMSEYDFPASINYVLSNTETKKLAYIGHSQGCLIALAKFSLNATIQSKISVFIAFAPAVYLNHMESPLRLITQAMAKMGSVLRLLNHGEFLPEFGLLKTLSRQLCAENRAPIVCEIVMYLFAGYNDGNTNVSRIPVYTAHAPVGTSIKNMQHFGQMIGSGKLRRFDYGMLKNLWIYGQIHPPEFNLSKTTVPTAIFYGGNDTLVVEEDASHLAFEINTTLIGQYLLKHYQHLDFTWGLNAGYVLYPPVLKILRRY